MQIKKQLKIELNHQDILVAIRNYMLSHGQKVSDDELADVKFVNSAQSGVRATLNVTEETDTEGTEESIVATQKEAQVEAAVVSPTEPVEEVRATEDAVEEEAPGEVETSTVDDVMPSIDEAAALAAEAEPKSSPAVEEEDGEVPAPTEGLRKSLFL